MSLEQRERIKAQLVRPSVSASCGRTIAQIRAGCAAFMKTMRVPAGTHSVETSLGGSAALLVEPDTGAMPCTILYFHGGPFLMGAPETGMPLTARPLLF